jgi:hypothetical protein
MKKFINGFFILIGTIYCMNALYVFFLTSESDKFRVFGVLETNKLTAGFIYLGLSLLLFWSLRKEDENEKQTK